MGRSELGREEVTWLSCNQERGWNDPPQFSYGLQTQPGSGKRTLLNKRAPAPLQGPPPVPAPQSVLASTPPKLPPACPASILGPPPLGLGVSPLRAEAVQQCPSVTESDIDVKDILAPLNQTLDACRDVVKKQVCGDISRRLTMLEEMWNNGKLSPSVRKRMSILVRELKCKNWDSADEIHRSLMVDHVNEVGQWMVGVKRLIAEARNLPAEALVTKEDQTSTDSSEEAVKPDN
ncbi:steroid receptor RNA activator 1 isoform X2 [Ascaphus truei]|uniref:steroid receptor RNA activator 1 isoform X2 n=1 Tax=Ascaphus truei TaxID=8439 RepID=UPI003F591B56